MKNKTTFYFVFFLFFAFACGNSDTPQPETSFTGPQDLGLVANDNVNEASGLAVSRSNPNFLWTHNDSGDLPRIFLLGNDGADYGVYTLEGATHTDWEDMAIAARGGANYIHVADIGDNNAVRDEVRIYRFAEPNVSQVSTPQTQTISSANIQTIRIAYPDGARNAETVLVNSLGDIYIVSKENNKAGIYKITFPQSTTDLNTLTKLGEITLSGQIVGGDAIKGVILKTYTQVFYWQNTAQAPDGLYENLMLNASPQIVNSYVTEPQGEALAFSSDEQSFYTLSEEPLASFPARLYLYQK